MTLVEMLIALILAIAMIFVGYKIYFFPQKYLFNRASSPVTATDRRIPFRPKWVWIYSGIYYPFWVSPILVVSSLEKFFSVCASYVALLFAQTFIAHLYPVKTPTDWRRYDQDNSQSELFLSFVQKYDRGGNGFPSMHVAISVLTTLHIVQMADSGIYPAVYVVWMMPIFIALSTLFTKQHLIIDVPAGAILAVAVYAGYANFGYVG